MDQLLFVVHQNHSEKINRNNKDCKYCSRLVESKNYINSMIIEKVTNKGQIKNMFKNFIKFKELGVIEYYWGYLISQ